MDRNIIVEYYRPLPAGDANVGSGYGTTSPKGLGSEYSRESTYPYRADSYEDDLEFDEDLDDFVDEELLGDLNLINRMMNKASVGSIASDPVSKASRSDRAGFATGQRFDLAPLSETEMPPTRRGDSVYGTMTPISFKSLYKGFSGPALGGTSTSFAYKTGPGRKSGTQYGTSRAPLPTDDDGIRVTSLEDIPDPSVRAIIKTRNTIKNVLSDRF
jgi:hypothetical protein